MENKLSNLRRYRTRLLNTKIKSTEQAEFIQDQLNEVEFKINQILREEKTNDR